MINEIISTVLQIFAFSLIPLVVWMVKNKSVKGFFHYIGLKASNRRANLLAVGLSLVFTLPILLLVILNEDFLAIMAHPESMTGKFKLMGFSFSALLLVLITAIFKTAFSEEILFRGFLAKQLIRWLGFRSGNLLHAVLFGALHTAVFLSISNNVLFLIIIFFFPALGAYLQTYLNEKVAQGSILPGWIAHALANVTSYSIIGFCI